ncbi:MAG: Ni/Fe hydrogenase subunit alpha [Patescibacteria group bacterium]|nr:Ni/Fe hydrogenase subunit alpha [Patescibacteria group bacterium]
MPKKIIKINHLAKMEGHASFEGKILAGEISEAHIITEEGARLIEGTLVGRHYSEAPTITSRICGICPIVHHLTAVKALEKCFDVRVSSEVVMLRKILELAQVIHSHALHLFFLSLPDFLNYDDTKKMAGRYPNEAQMAIDIRKWATDLCLVIGGRITHPLTNMVGGFRKWPEEENLEKFLDGSGDILEMAQQIAQLFRDLDYPKFKNLGNFIALSDDTEYAIYDGEIKIWETKKNLVKKIFGKQMKGIEASKFVKKIKEIELRNELVKRVNYNGKPFFCGALARININKYLLNEEAAKFLETANIDFPTSNTFYNVLAQAVELIHCVEEIRNLLRELKKINWLDVKNASFKVKAGQGVAAIEAPRGTLYHYYETDKKGYIKNCNIITPTAQFLAKLEDDLSVFLSEFKNLSDIEREKKIKMMIRAFDPCISCATH